MWTKVQDQIALNRNRERIGDNDRIPSLLAGMIFDDHDSAMTPSHAVKKGKRYRYYISRSLQQDKENRGSRIPAGYIEHIVSHRMRLFLSDRRALHQAIESHVTDARIQQRILSKANQLIADWEALSIPKLRSLLICLRTKVHIKLKEVEISIDANQVSSIFEQYPAMDLTPKQSDEHNQELIFTVPAVLKRAGVGIKLHIEGEGSKPDPKLMGLLAKAEVYYRLLSQDKTLSIRSLATREGVGSSYVSRILRLHFLAPDIKKTILQGRQPPKLTARQITLDSRFPIDWEGQRKQLGFPARP